MALAAVGTGTLSADGTEQTVDTETGGKTYVFSADLSDLANGETCIIRMKTKIISGGMSRQAHRADFANVQDDPNVYSVPVPALYELVVTIEATNGVSIPWTLMSID